MRFLFSILGAALVVFIITMIATYIYSKFPDDNGQSSTPIQTSRFIDHTDYTLETLQCTCQSDQLERTIQELPNKKVGCLKRILTVTLRRDLPECELNPTS